MATTISPNLKLKYCINHTNPPTTHIEKPENWRDVIFVEPRETFTEPMWTPKGMIEQEYARVANPDIWGGKIRIPFESEFVAVGS